MTNLSCNVIAALHGKTLATAESCTGGGIGAALTAVPGSSAVFKGGVISYTDQVKNEILGVDSALLLHNGAVSRPVAEAMATGVKKLLRADIALSVTGLAGPDGDNFGNPVGTVYIGYCSDFYQDVQKFYFMGSREEIRDQTIKAALKMILDNE